MEFRVYQLRRYTFITTDRECSNDSGSVKVVWVHSAHTEAVTIQTLQRRYVDITGYIRATFDDILSIYGEKNPAVTEALIEAFL